jgi:aryl-alcohol dehydrogenase-like predicted oxidoreductase
VITRPLGRTGHRSSVLAFGGAAFVTDTDGARAGAALDDALARGVNHVDVAPLYGEAERVLGPAIARNRDRLFLACKTLERRGRKARDELHRSLERLRTDRFDLYQCHSVSDAFDLERLLAPGGALEAIVEARDQGLVRFVGITGHHCAVLKQAIERFPFDTVMFPLNPIQAADPRPATDYRPLLAATIARGVGAIGIKAIARGPWATRAAAQAYTTWYRPYDEPAEMTRRIRFALSHLIATTVLPSDTRLWPPLFEAAASFEPLGDDEVEAMVRDARGSEPLYVESMKLALPAR